jgi:cyclopropane fatty-acyl-phospholipid synthase-like methyltransferase
MTEVPEEVAYRNQRYRLVEEPAMRSAEMRVVGSDYGATSYTTRAQADRMARLLELGPGRLLLDVGSGAGWPGIYLADSTGSGVVLTDIPFEGLRVAARRVRAMECGPVLSLRPANRSRSGPRRSTRS